MMELAEKALLYVTDSYSKNDNFHSLQHIRNVLNQAIKIMKALQARGYEVNEEILTLAVIFHDANYHSGETERESYENHPEASVKVMKEFLLHENYPLEKIAKVQVIMLDHSGPHRNRMGDAYFVEGKIIYDADKSIFITDQVTFDKFYNKLYFDESKSMVPFPDNPQNPQNIS